MLNYIYIKYQGGQVTRLNFTIRETPRQFYVNLITFCLEVGRYLCSLIGVVANASISLYAAAWRLHSALGSILASSAERLT